MEALTLDALLDSPFGDITTSGHDGIVSTTCEVPKTIKPMASYTCSFDVELSTGQHTDTVTGTVSDNDGNTMSMSDSASVNLQ